MNQAAQEYWNEYWKNQNQPQSVSAWQFGADPDYLAQLVVDGNKTATCSGYVFYELENESLPTSEDYSILSTTPTNCKNRNLKGLRRTESWLSSLSICRLHDTTLF